MNNPASIRSAMLIFRKLVKAVSNPEDGLKIRSVFTYSRFWILSCRTLTDCCPTLNSGHSNQSSPLPLSIGQLIALTSELVLCEPFKSISDSGLVLVNCNMTT